MKQLIKYPGSKWALAKWIIEHFPEHHSYLEPFFGSGAVLFNKAPAPIETINDIDGNVVNLFECIKEDPEKLARIISLTPYARDVYDRAYKDSEKDPYEKAAAFITRCDMGHGFRQNGEKAGFKMDIQGREAAYAVRHWNDIPELIMQCALRLKQVQIENRPAIDVIKRFNSEKVLIYADPPYMLETRHGVQYSHEMSDKDHEELLQALISHKGPVILSGYDNELYNDMLKGWEKDTHMARNQLAKSVEETIWINFTPTSQMQMFQQ